MKKQLLFLLPLLMLMQVGKAQTSTPQHARPAGTTVASAIPFNNATNRIQGTYAPGEITPNGTAGEIHRVYFRSTAALNTPTFYNIMLAMDTTSLPAFAAAVPWVVLRDTVLKAATYTLPVNTTANGWFALDLQKPYYYSGTDSFIIDASAIGTVPSGLSIAGQNGFAKRRATGVIGDAATTGTGASLFDFGFDYIANDDAGIVSLASPTAGICAGSQSIKVRVKNYGHNRINNVILNWTVDGTPQTPVTYNAAFIDSFFSGVINTVDVTLGNVTFGSKATHAIKAWTSQPNGNTDPTTNNDTISVSLTSSLPSGTYTIGPSGADYATIGAAVTDLNTYGVCGPAIFNIATGTYTEQNTINNIPGASTINTVTFQPASGKLGDVNLQFTPTTAAGVLNFNSTSYVTLKKILITNTYAGTSAFTSTMQWTGLVSNNLIDSCRLICQTPTTASGNCLNAQTGLVAGSGGNIIRYTRIQGGNVGLYYAGNATISDQTCLFEYDTAVNQFGTGIRISNVDNCKIRHNTVTLTSAASSGTGLFFGGTGSYEVTYNKVSVTATGNSTYIGISLSSVSSTIPYGLLANNNISISGLAPTYGIQLATASMVNIMNNSIVVQGSTNSATYGIFNNPADHINYYNNSISVTGGSVSTAAVFALMISNNAGNTNIDIKNNILSSNSNATVNAPLFIATVATNITSDYNNLYNAATANIAAMGATAPYTYSTSIPAWRTKGQDLHSLSYRPGFTSATDLRPNPTDTAVWSLNGRGIQITGNNTDILNNPRSTTLANGAPDLGAYEFTPGNIPPKDSAVPALPVANSTQYFTFGGDTVATIAWGATVPASVAMRQYSGTVPAPPYSGTNMDFYTDLSGPAGTYSYTENLYYRRSWLRAAPLEVSLRMIKSNGTTWQEFNGSTSSVDSIKKIITAPSMTTLGLYSGAYIAPVVGVITGNLTICKGATTQLADTSVNGTWSSATPAVATISNTGLVTSVGVGTTVISYAAPFGTVTATVTVNDTPTVAAITGTDSVCQGLTTQLSNATPSGVWSSTATTTATVSVTGLVTASAVNSGPTTIKYIVTNTSTCSTSVSRIVKVNAKPAAPSAIGGASPLCQGASETLTSTPANGLWSTNAPTIASVDFISGQVTASTANTGNATITYSITNSSNCANSVTATVTVNASPVATIAPTSTVHFCEGDSATLTTNMGTGLTYQWLNGTPITGAIDTAYVAKTSGNYSVEVTNALGCKDTSAVDTVVAYPLPTPVISYTKPILSTGSYSHYQWYKDGQIITGANNQTYTATGNGNYYVVVIDAHDCSKQSATDSVQDFVGINNVTAGNKQVHIYPNPATDIVTIAAPVSINVTVCAMDGKVVLQQNNATTINVSNLSDALYLVRVYDQNGQLLQIEKLVKAAR